MCHAKLFVTVDWTVITQEFCNQLYTCIGYLLGGHYKMLLRICATM